MGKWTVLVVVSLVLVGCVSLPPPRGQAKASAPSYVGDARSIGLEEVVVSVPMAEPAGSYQNLHVRVSALVNARAISLADERDVTAIIERSWPRLSAGITKAVLAHGTATPSALAGLHAAVETRMRTDLGEVFSHWTRAGEFEIEAVVTSIYFTDGSAPVVQGGRYWGW